MSLPISGPLPRVHGLGILRPPSPRPSIGTRLAPRVQAIAEPRIRAKLAGQLRLAAPPAPFRDRIMASANGLSRGKSRGRDGVSIGRCLAPLWGSAAFGVGAAGAGMGGGVVVVGGVRGVGERLARGLGGCRSSRRCGRGRPRTCCRIAGRLLICRSLPCCLIEQCEGGAQRRRVGRRRAPMGQPAAARACIAGRRLSVGRRDP
jgi:hypothetical protein